MKIQISAHNLEISSRFHDYVADRAPKIEHYVHQEADLVIKVTRHDHSRTAGPEDEVESLITLTPREFRHLALDVGEHHR